MLTSYTTIQPPFSLKFREMPKAELRQYYQWFMSSIPERIRILTQAVNDTPGYENWMPDETPNSLEPLSVWFSEHVETRPLTIEEQDVLKQNMTFPIPLPEFELTNQTYSLAMDIGMYLGQVMVKNHPSLKWNQASGSKKYVEYGQVVIQGFKANMEMNPVRLVIVLAYKITDGLTGGGLTDIMKRWVSHISI